MENLKYKGLISNLFKYFKSNSPKDSQESRYFRNGLAFRARFDLFK